MIALSPFAAEMAPAIVVLAAGGFLGILALVTRYQARRGWRPRD